MQDAGRLTKTGERYEFRFEELGLSITGAHPEWVLSAAAEIIQDVERLKVAGRIEELTMLSEMGEADEMDVEDVRFAAEDRFETMPHCLVSMGDTDYRWVAPDGRKGEDVKRKPPVERVHQVSPGRPD
ncbi:MAG: hypothetical protein AAFQ88_04545 [Pseudomonadota bacterium]